jgi:hypothetical protein
VRAVGFMVFGIMVLLITWSGVGVIETNYQLQKQVSELQQQNSIMQLQNGNAKLQNQYYDSEQYLELQARKQLNKGLPGEQLLLVPKGVSMANTMDLSSKDETKKQKKQEHKPLYQRNLEAWRAFFTHSLGQNQE